MMETKKITRSRKGCHTCKRLKIKCDESKPSCGYCTKKNRKCDYTLVLNWGGRSKGSKSSGFNIVTFNAASPMEKPRRRPTDHESCATPLLGASGKSPPIVIEEVCLKQMLHSPSSYNSHNTHAQRSVDMPNMIHSNIDHSLSKLVQEYTQRQEPHDVSTRKRSPTDIGTHIAKKQRNSYLSLNELVEPGFQAISPSVTYSQTTSNSHKSQTVPEIENIRNSMVSPSSTGMDDLFDALDAFAYNGAPFQIDSLDTTQSTVDEYRPNHAEVAAACTQSHPRFIEQVDNFLVDYANDIEQIEKYLPKVEPNYNWSYTRLIRGSPSNSSDSDSQSWEIIDPESIFEIPRFIQPLPTLLLEVPFYKDLLHFWVNVTSKQLVPAPYYEDNPFTILLTQMAMEYPSILTTLLAFSAKSKAGLIDSSDTPEGVIEQLLARSCTELLKLLKNRNSATSNAALATSLILGCFELMNSPHDFNQHRAHTIGARQIIKARASVSRRHSSVSEQEIENFLVRWFVYVDLIGGLSASHAQNYVMVNDENDKYEPLEAIVVMNKQRKSNFDYENPAKHIDQLMGFDTKFLRYFMKIVMLIRKVDQYLKDNEEAVIPLAIVQEALEIKETMLEICREDEEELKRARMKFMVEKQRRSTQLIECLSPSYTINKIQENEILGYTNKVFCDTGILHMYRRVLKVPRNSPIVQTIVNGIAKIMQEHIVPKSPTDICCIFCFFSAGCETLDGELQSVFENRFTQLIEMGNINAKKGLQIMKRCWETNEDWLTAANTLDIDFIVM